MSNDFDMGLQAIYAGDPVKAENLLTKAISSDPNNAEAYFHRGKARWQNGNLAAAINDFQKVLDIKPLHNQAKVSLEMVKQIIGFRNPDLYNP
jgi:cytochrome c-type biogenesis protein CcmH/NrfG